MLNGILKQELENGLGGRCPANNDWRGLDMKTLKLSVKIYIMMQLLLGLPLMQGTGTAAAAGLYDYCIIPPFIQEIAKPNLLMIIDNSASMYDLAYVDKGKKHCSATTTRACFLNTDCNYCSATTARSCTANKECPANETCVITNETCTGATLGFDRQPFYCFDQTYRSGNTYVGYFNRLQADNTSKQYYSYNFGVGMTNMGGSSVKERLSSFDLEPTFSCSGKATEHVKSVNGELCIIYDTALAATDQVTKFLASGNYLNWLNTSKFDIEKKVLTGGRYLPAAEALAAESRGCVGQGYIKDALTADFVNYNDGAANTNTQLGVSFRVKGPPSTFNSVSPSVGGPAYFDIWASTTKTFDFGVCQKAITDIATGGNADIKKSVDDCLQNTTPASGSCAQNGQLCVASFLDPANPATTTPNCNNPVTVEHCQNGLPNTSCTDAIYTGGNCIISGAKSCTNIPSRVCTGDPGCDEKVCSLDNAITCTSAEGSTIGCGVIAEVMGTCSKGSGTCKVANDCSNKQALCSGYKAAANRGTCHLKSSGTCISADVNKGPCVAGSGGYVGPCTLPSGAAVTKTKVAFQQNMQECWKIRGTVQSAPDYGFANMNTIKNQCPDIFGSYKACSDDLQKQCTVNADCTSNSCLSGPAAIGPGNPALLCGNQFAGLYYQQVSPYTLLGTDSQLAAAQYAFCNSMNAPNVPDPTDSPANSPATSGIPAILSGMGIESQLGEPISHNNRTRIKVPLDQKGEPFVPTGLVQEYANKIRMGAMTFNNYGAAYEAANIATLATATNLARVTATKLCSTASGAAAGTRCLNELDCGGVMVGAGATSWCTTDADRDGAKVISLIGSGSCSTTTSTPCSKSAHCPVGEKCIPSEVGNHATADSLISKLDNIKAATWTPFAEALYDAIGYFAIDATDATGKKSRTDLRLNSDLFTPANSDFPDAMNPSEYVCQANNILLITDGGSTADLNPTMTAVVDQYKVLSGNVTGACDYFQGSKDLDDLAWIARHRNINTFSKSVTSTDVPVKKNQWINTFVVSTGADNGLDVNSECNNLTLLKKTADNGGTSLLKTDLPEQYEETLRSAFSQVAGGTASGTAASILSNSEGSGANILQAVFYPFKEFETETGATTPSNASWIGEMQNLWYYVDPYINNSTVREDTNKDKALHVVDDYVVDFQFKGGETIATLTKDTNGDGTGDTVITTALDPRVMSQGYCSVTTGTKCAADSACPAGETCAFSSIVSADDVNSLWRAGKQLWTRNISTSPRKLYTYLYGTSATGCSGSFSVNEMVNLVGLKKLDNTALSANDKCIIEKLLQASDSTEAQSIINFAHGYDTPTVGSIDGDSPRKRTVAIAQKNPDGTKVMLAGKPVTDSHVWKLGDIIASTPRIQSFNKLNNYHIDPPSGYGDTTYANDSNGTGFANSTGYKGRGMAYTGANDGMLHAFNLGLLNVSGSGQTKATLTGSNLGEEQWAFIPKNVLPYLKYLASPNYVSAHIYLVDGPTRLLDTSIGYNDNSYMPAATITPYLNAGCDASGSGAHTKYWACQRDPATTSNQSWRTVIIGSMGIGGASANLGSTCTDCIKSPVDGVGYSSYFAIDITNPAAPVFLWEFSDPDLGAATSGAAVARIAYPFTEAGIPYKDTNGRWFAVIGNGPTGPIDTTYFQYKGKSANPLRIFVLDLKTGALLRKSGDAVIGFTDQSPASAISNAFTGGMVSAPMDTDRTNKISDGFYSDDVLYFGYVNDTAPAAVTPAWNGGIMRLLTYENIDPAAWSLSTVISGIGPVTTMVSKLQDRKNHALWLFTGTGRYYFKGDDSTVPGKIVGLKEPCYDIVNDDIFSQSAIAAQATKCTNAIAFAATDFADQTSVINTMDNKKGWLIGLVGEDTVNSFGAERIITEPVVMSTGAVFFTSFMPSVDICNYGGKSYMWGMRYDTGGTAASNMIQGKALIQVSTGAFEQVNLATQLTESLNRKMGTPMIGKPPTDPPPIVSSSGNKPLKRILHMQEK